MITMIWCEDASRGIGFKNKMPWDIKEEMQHFRSTTKNKIVVMGRKTLESIGGLLPFRTNIVLTRDLNYVAPKGAIVYHDFKKLIADYKNEDVFIIGGKSIYDQFLPYADCLIVSKLNKEYKCDCHMDIEFSNFKEVKRDLKPEFIVYHYERKE